MNTQTQIEEVVVDRLLDYLSFKGFSIGDRDPRSVNLDDIGFDDIDWGILIGEIQCDTKMLFDWRVNLSDVHTLGDIISNLKPASFENFWQLHDIMVSLWDTESLEKIVTNAGENIWEC